MSITITSPVEGYTADSYVGSTKLTFTNGTAEVDELDDGVRAYLLGAGYTVDGESVSAPASLDGNEILPADAVDARDYAEPTQVGTKLRDAAVDPRPEDFLPPTNAGEADPHGPEVVSPEVHASQGTRPIKGGDVHVDDPDAQEKAETEHTEQATSGAPVAAGPVPSGNASADVWREYAIANGADAEAVKDLGRNALRDQYGPKK